jgi:hypothetical protein
LIFFFFEDSILSFFTAFFSDTTSSFFSTFLAEGFKAFLDSSFLTFFERIFVLNHSLHWGPVLKRSKLILVFIIYLFIHIFFLSDDLKIALASFKSEWMHFILFSLAGAGSALLLAKKQIGHILLYLGLAFSLPILIHLTLLAIQGFSSGSIPWGYSGLSETHGDLAYPSLQAAIFLSVFCLIKVVENG